jgi:hypothetical protein
MARSILFALSMGIMLSSLATVPAFAQATSSVKCSDGVVTVSTGSGGRCTNKDNVINCQNPASKKGLQSDWAYGGCDNKGKAMCGDSEGHGSCTITREAPSKPSKGGATTRPGSVYEP